MSRDLLLVAGTACLTYYVVYKILSQQPKASATTSCSSNGGCGDQKGCCAEQKCAEQKGCCAEPKPDVEACRAAHNKAKKDLAHAENKLGLGQMPKRMVEAVRRKEAEAKAALDAAIAAA